MAGRIDAAAVASRNRRDRDAALGDGLADEVLLQIELPRRGKPASRHATGYFRCFRDESVDSRDELDACVWLGPGNWDFMSLAWHF